MVGVASAVAICAILLYIVDSRDRKRHEKLMQSRRQDEENQKGQMETIASSAADSPARTHPTEYVDEEIDSISRVSTMTSTSVSILDGPSSPSDEDDDDSDDDDDDDSDLDSSLEVVELDEENRLTYDTDLSSLVDLSRVNTNQSVASCDDRNKIKANEEVKEEEEDDGSDLRFDSLVNLNREDNDYLARAARMPDFSDDSSSEGESGWNSQSDVSSETSLATFLTSHAASIASSRDSFSVDTPRMLEQGNAGGPKLLLGAPKSTSNSVSDETSYVSSSSAGNIDDIVELSDEEEPFDASDPEIEDVAVGDDSSSAKANHQVLSTESSTDPHLVGAIVTPKSNEDFSKRVAKLQTLYKPRDPLPIQATEECAVAAPPPVDDNPPSDSENLGLDEDEVPSLVDEPLMEEVSVESEVFEGDVVLASNTTISVDISEEAAMLDDSIMAPKAQDEIMENVAGVHTDGEIKAASSSEVDKLAVVSTGPDRTANLVEESEDTPAATSSATGDESKSEQIDDHSSISSVTSGDSDGMLGSSTRVEV